MQKKMLKKETKYLHKTDFLFLNTEIVFIELKQAFILLFILFYFNSKCFIWIKTDISSHAICEILSHLSLNTSSQYYLIGFFLRKMI